MMFRDPIFNGDEQPLYRMERAGLILLNVNNGRPCGILAGRPVYTTAFKQMMSDVKLCAVMGVFSTKQVYQIY